MKQEERSYAELQEELKAIISKAKGVPVNSYNYVLLKHQATKLHVRLIEIESFIKNSQEKFRA